MSELAYEDIKIGNEASLTRTITEVHIVNYAGLTGDMNPVHVDAEHAAQSMFGERIAHGMLVAGLISAVLGTQLPGPNSIYLGQDLNFVAPVMIGDTIKVVVTVTDKGGPAVLYVPDVLYPAQALRDRVEGTVKLHRANLVRKLQARSVSDLVRMADRLQEPAPLIPNARVSA